VGFSDKVISGNKYTWYNPNTRRRVCRDKACLVSTVKLSEINNKKMSIFFFGNYLNMIPKKY